MEAYDNKYIIVFASHSQATFVFSELTKKGINIEFMSTPSKIALGCSKSIIFNSEHIKIVVAAVKNIKATVNGIYKVVKINGDYDYIKI